MQNTNLFFNAMTIFWNNWLIIAFIAPFLWALVNIIDAYFAKEIYQDEYDGAIVSGFFQVIPWLAVPFIGLSLPEMNTLLLAVLGGLFFCVSMFFYFKAIYASGDVSLIQIFWNLTAIIVPILTFFILKERLSGFQYIGILTTFIGAALLSLHRGIHGNNFKRFLVVMSGAIFFLSLSMVVEDIVYSKTEFFSGFLFFALGYFIGSLIIFNINKKKSTKYLYKLCKKYSVWFFVIEAINLAAIIFSQRAISISPSVSFVAVIESFVPAFILLLSILFLVIFSFKPFRKQVIIRSIYRDQIAGSLYKIVAILIMTFGIFLISS
jgi:drug/metabolite transporter (DMT)-like permease